LLTDRPGRALPGPRRFLRPRRVGRGASGLAGSVHARQQHMPEPGRGPRLGLSANARPRRERTPVPDCRVGAGHGAFAPRPSVLRLIICYARCMAFGWPVCFVFATAWQLPSFLLSVDFCVYLAFDFALSCLHSMLTWWLQLVRTSAIMYRLC
jgi:hypothetical protein